MTLLTLHNHGLQSFLEWSLNHSLFLHEGHFCDGQALGLIVREQHPLPAETHFWSQGYLALKVTTHTSGLQPLLAALAEAVHLGEILSEIVLPFILQVLLVALEQLGGIGL